MLNELTLKQKNDNLADLLRSENTAISSILNQPDSILEKVKSFISQTGLEDVKSVFDSKKGNATITGVKDGLQYTTTVQMQNNGIIQTNSQFSTNLGSEALGGQIMQLRAQNFTQCQVADMLGISQAAVSKYENKYKKNK